MDADCRWPEGERRGTQRMTQDHAASRAATCEIPGCSHWPLGRLADDFWTHCAQGVADVPIYGRIAVLQLFRPQVRIFWAPDSPRASTISTMNSPLPVVTPYLCMLVPSYHGASAAGGGQGCHLFVHGALHVLPSLLGLRQRCSARAGVVTSNIWHYCSVHIGSLAPFPMLACAHAAAAGPTAPSIGPVPSDLRDIYESCFRQPW